MSIHKQLENKYVRKTRFNHSLIVLAVLFLNFTSYSQLKPASELQLQQLFFDQINTLRSSNGVPCLKFNDTLKKAAKNQSEFNAKSDVLSHVQKNKLTANPADRVLKFGGDNFIQIEEIVLVSVPTSAFTPESIKSTIVGFMDAMNEKAKETSILRDAELQTIGIGFKQHAPSKKVYCTLLLAKKGYEHQTQLSEAEDNLMRDEVMRLINELRISLKLNPLSFQPKLQKAAQNHTDYLIQTKTLSHDQKNPFTKTPSDRVKNAGGTTFELVGENILKSKRIPKPFDETELKLHAKALFEQWKNSPPHYQNMINPSYTLADFSFKVQTTEGVFYGTTVFGKEGIQVKNQLSKDVFGLVPGTKICDTLHSRYMNVIRGMGDNTVFEDNNVILYFHDRSLFEKIFKHENDGIAVDLIHPNQFACGAENQLDFSPLYDGILLQPIFRDELFKNNEANSPYRVITKIGSHPGATNLEDYSTASFLIYKGQTCIYSYPVKIPARDYALKPLTPKREDPSNISLVDEGIVETEIIHYNFKTNITQPFTISKFSKPVGKFVSATIKSYSSVEGDSASNHQLHTNRANWIEDHLKKTLAIPENLIRTDAKENWELMRFQLNYFKMDELAKQSNDSLRKFIPVRPATVNWDSLFLMQRLATATISYFGKYSLKAKTETKAFFSLRTAVISKNADLANKALYALYDEKKSSRPELFEDYILDYFINEPKCIVNYTALLTRYYLESPYECVRYIAHWVENSSQLTEEAKSNLIQLYAILADHFLNSWDVSAKHLSHVINPEKVSIILPKNPAEDLMLNAQMAFIQYYGQINDRKHIESCFGYINSYFSKHSLTPEDDVNLGLFYNNWTAYDLTVQHLVGKYRKKNINEDGLFLLANTMEVAREWVKAPEREAIHTLAIEKNKKRWCEFIDDNFQLKRDAGIKGLYCKKCGE